VQTESVAEVDAVLVALEDAVEDMHDTEDDVPRGRRSRDRP